MSSSETAGVAIAAGEFVEVLVANGYDFATGVPCSYFGRLIAILEQQRRFPYIGAVREDSAIGIAAGAYLGGRQPAVFMQNSGFASIVNALGSLNLIYDIPALLLVTWRGEGGRRGDDAPEHFVVGETMIDLFRLLEIPYEVAEAACLGTQVGALTATLRRTRHPVALVLREGTIR